MVIDVLHTVNWKQNEKFNVEGDTTEWPDGIEIQIT
jgi:hypothetical protein